MKPKEIIMKLPFQKLKLRGLGAWTCALFLSFSAAAGAAAYPERTVEIIVPYAAGGSTDSTARLVAKGLSDQLKQSFVVVNRPGAGGMIAHADVSKADPNGYTLLFSAAGPLTVTPHSYDNIAYDPLKAFKPIKLVSAVPLMLVVNPKLKDHDLESLIKLAKDNPGSLNYGSFGVGSAAHLAGEQFKLLTKVDITHVPYKGSAPALADLLGGQIDMMFDVLVTALPHVQSGKLLPIAVTSDVRSSLLPEVPTMAEAGVQGFEAQTWFGLLAPANVDQSVIDELSKAMDAVLADPEIKKTILSQGMEIQGGTPADFDAFFRSEYDKWGAIAKQAGIKK
ncbi:hypothetical protein CKA81_16990 [Pollutimonas thiosulfatoxidans]|uniref:LacI family transcriptional regulator n=2 Tax=Pollutimonas thiosulfatoxidans TaxID=2028345 RepID=A0A410GGG5_9BURK|nr:hypothetical protein CKA81_16990 [Pollutimonas thiosulfatoxidans]